MLGAVGRMSDRSVMRIALIGAGAMGGAILSGWCNTRQGVASTLSGPDFIVIDPSREKCADIQKEFGASASMEVSDLADSRFDMVVLAVKPQIMENVLEELSGLPAFNGNPAEMPLVVTIAAGVPTSKYEAALPKGVRVVRVMPNMPLQVMAGASAVAKGANATQQDAQLVKELFESLGAAWVVDECQIDAVCAISGGGPAYVAKFIEDMTAAGVAAGLDARVAESLAVATVSGSAKILSDGLKTPEELRVSVCSPGGTTLAALAAMDEAGFTEAIGSGISAAINRAKELA